MSFTCVKLLVVQFSKINLINNFRCQLLYHIMSGSECQAFFRSFSTSFMKLVIQRGAYWLTSWPELEYTMLVEIMQVFFDENFYFYLDFLLD
ncbi:hypothetical protein, partial [Paenibacillus sp. An7]|uniref:hypothetical protein n=1 Tax=Paenibacillus sp. An7 TaxID=2689577 RepID=UPI001F3B4B97